MKLARARSNLLSQGAARLEDAHQRLVDAAVDMDEVADLLDEPGFELPPEVAEICRQASTQAAAMSVLIERVGRKVERRRRQLDPAT